MMQKDHFFNGGGAPPPPPPLLFEPTMRDLDATWGCSQDEYAQFELPVSSTSMAAAAMDSGGFAISELIGELSSMYGSRPPFAATYGNVGDIYSLGNSLPLSTPAISPAPAKLSCLASRSFNGRTAQSRSSSPSLKQPGTEPRPEPSFFSGHTSIPEPSAPSADQLPSGGSSGELNPRKRKPVSGIKTDGHSNAKKSKQSKETEREVKDDNGGGDGNESNQKPFEPPKDYIHVRARRGQATDSHSLAERVRREKISERMKLLQDLVPGCNKVTGKALMLDEIINYVQSLQRQVEFLSMKLATLNPRVDCNAPNLLPKDICQTNEALPHHAYTSDSPGPAFRYAKIPQLNAGIPNGALSQCPPPSLYSLDASPSLGMHFPSMDSFGETLSQFPLGFEDDLQSIVKMGFN
ncbi:hypothetical protein DM860_012539 [Cuscuta australis]|uniref:BHLH domain-containing protein n=1 Tax=Cuscuta australis TaxID=267555 RepID=A0A328DFR8_9ASTE|nr:hypothetical protein DM860_012539 [Cuscuta australis]